MAKVILNNISKSFGKKEILKNINLEINDGEFIVLVGASGCGKSTLLRMIAGLEKIDSGTVTIGEKCVNNVSAKDRDIAMVFQSYALYPHLNVKENIALGLKVRHIPKCEIKKRISRSVEILKLEEKLEAKPKELSGGQRQRVALARAIVREPKVFLMDEPLSNLDAKLRSEMRSEIKKLHKRLKTTFIYVTHDQTEALTMGDRIVVLNNGEIQQIDTPHNIYNNPQNIFTATFMGTNPMNIIEGIIDKNYLKFGGLTIDLNTVSYNVQNLEEPKKVYVGIRSEDIITNENPNFVFNSVKLKVKINFEENLGSTKNIYFNIDDKEFCALVSSKVSTKNEIEISINPKSIYLFDFEKQEPLNKKAEYNVL